uniref:RNA-guided endonuclease InsQ/TnpB family protein n=1 Tax=Ferroplasma sp. TaxID=2591003 RepID=UPI00307F5586
MKVNRTEQIYLKYDSNISNQCHFSKNLYNQVNYILRQAFLKKEKMPSYNNLVKQFQLPSENNENNNYQKLPAKTAQWTIKTTTIAWLSFFRAKKEYNKDPDKFTGRPGIPDYKEKNGEFILILTNQQCRIEDGILKFPRIMELEVKTRLKDVDLREVRIVPQGVGYTVEIVYRKEIEDIADRESKRIIGIDFGIRNTVTIADSIGNKPIAVKGGALNSVNQYFNKENARLKSISDRQFGNKFLTRREKKIFSMRKRKIYDIMHKISRFIVDDAREKGIDTIVMGHNEGWKQNVNIGKKNNQKFVQIPFNILISMIQYKAEESGIQAIVIDEAYTSKSSFLDNEIIEHHNNYAGKRTSRG